MRCIHALARCCALRLGLWPLLPIAPGTGFAALIGQRRISLQYLPIVFQRKSFREEPHKTTNTQNKNTRNKNYKNDKTQATQEPIIGRSKLLTDHNIMRQKHCATRLRDCTRFKITERKSNDNKDQASRIKDQGSSIKDQGSRIKDQGSRIPDPERIQQNSGAIF